MKQAQFASLSIGSVPRVVGTLCTLGGLNHLASIAARPCDIAEIRLDQIGESSDWMPASKRLVASGTPTLLTLRTVDEGGKCALDTQGRSEIYKSSWKNISAIDVEHERSGSAEVSAIAHDHGVPVISSFHDFKGTPPLSELLSRVTAAAEYADVVKISSFVNSVSDITTLETLLKTPFGKPLCVIGMGPLGTRTRTQFPLLGSCLTYGYIDTPAAPGQLSAAALRDHLRGHVTEARSQ